MNNYKDVYEYLRPIGNDLELEVGVYASSKATEQVVAVAGESAVIWAMALSRKSLHFAKENFSTLSDFPDFDVGRSLELQAFQVLLSLGGVERVVGLSEAIRSMAYQAVHLGVHFSDVVQGMREMQKLWADEALLLLPDSFDSKKVNGIVILIASVFDDSIKIFFEDYLSEKEALFEESVFFRRELVEELIVGSQIFNEDKIDYFRKKLGIDLDFFHVAMVGTVSKGSTGLQKDIQAELKSIFPNADTFYVPKGEQVWFWVSTSVLPLPSQLSTLAERLKRFEFCRFAVGEAAKHVDGFRRSHLQARALVALSEKVSIVNVPCWPEQAITALLVQNVELAEWFIQSTLGELAGANPKSESYRETLKYYLQSGNSLLYTAKELGVHRNTVVYRLQAIEDILGKSIKEHDLSLRCAVGLMELKRGVS